MTIRVHSTGDLRALQKKLGIKDQPRGKSFNRESKHQVAVFAWRKTQVKRFPSLARMHAIPNGGARDAVTAKILRAEGVLAGVADMSFPFAARGFHGLYIELKDIGREREKNGGATDSQMMFLAGVARDGFCSVRTYGSNQTIDVIEWYLGVRTEPPNGAYFYTGSEA